jgi:hypothetical protein
LLAYVASAAPRSTIPGAGKNGKFGTQIALLGDILGFTGPFFIASAPSGTPSIVSPPTGYAMILHSGNMQPIDVLSGVKNSLIGASLHGGKDVFCDDGNSSVVLGSPGYQSSAGQVQFGLYGNTLTSQPALFSVSFSILGDPKDETGWAVRLIDMDADGCSDLVYSSPGRWGGGGEVMALSLVKDEELFSFNGALQERLGRGALRPMIQGGSEIGMVIGSSEDSRIKKNGGSVRALVRKGFTAAGKPLFKEIWNFTKPAKNALVGASLSSDADFDGDNFNDVLIGAPGVGTVYVVSGAKGTVLATIKGGNGSQLGTALGVLPDIDADLIPEILVSDPAANVVYAYSGNLSWPTPIAIWKGKKGENFGTSLEIAPKSSSTGGPRLLVGASSAGAKNEGAVILIDDVDACDDVNEESSIKSGIYIGTAAVNGCPTPLGSTLKISGTPGQAFSVFRGGDYNPKKGTKLKSSLNKECTWQLPNDAAVVAQGTLDSTGAATVTVPVTVSQLKTKSKVTAAYQVRFGATAADAAANKFVGCTKTAVQNNPPGINLQ